MKACFSSAASSSLCSASEPTAGEAEASRPDPLLLAEVLQVLAPVKNRCWDSGLWKAEA